MLQLQTEGTPLLQRVAPGHVTDFIIDLCYGLVSAMTNARGAVSVPLHVDEEAWELGLQADAKQVRISAYCPGPIATVAAFERPIAVEALANTLRSTAERLLQADFCTLTARSSLQSALEQLAQLPKESRCEPQRRQQVTVAEAAEGVRLTLRVSLAERPQPEAVHHAQLERADLHPLLMDGELQVDVQGAAVCAMRSQVFLDLERLLELAECALDSYLSARPTFRRALLSTTKFSVRRGPGDAPIELGVAADAPKGKRSVLAGRLSTAAFVRLVAFASQQLASEIERADPLQQRNLRLTSFKQQAKALVEQLTSNEEDESQINPRPDSYRRFAPRLRRSVGVWESGPKMRFMPRWVATVPGLDLRSTFLCGEHLMVGAAHETTCLHRRSGEVVWKRATRPAACVVTPSGLIRVEPDGRLTCHQLSSGEVRFTLRVQPRAAGGATGAVLHGPGMPRLLALTEGDRQVTGIDLLSGDVKWRYTGRRPGSFRIRRAGRLLMVTGGDPLMVAIDGPSGEVVWQLRGRLPFSGDVAVDRDCAFALMGCAGGSWSLVTFNPWSGERGWVTELDERPMANRAPLLTPNQVVIPTFDDNGVGAVAYCRHSGKKLWEHAPGLLKSTTAWLAVDDCVIANGASGVLLGISGDDGSMRFSHVFSSSLDADQPRRLEPVLRNGALFVPQSEVVVVRPRDGELLGRLPTDLIPDLIRVDERCDVYVAEESGHFAAFGAAPKLSVVRTKA